MVLTLCAGLIPFRLPSQNQPPAKVRPANVEVMRNMGLDAAKSGLPVYLPREWGRLVSVQKSDGAGYFLFLENEDGQIYIVRLNQRGQYLYLDTYDQGGVALVIGRNP